MPGETLGIVGESGCGKSVTSLSIMRLLDMPPAEIPTGEIMFEGRDLLALSDEEMRKVRGNDIAMIFQEPMTSLNPVFSVGDQIAEAVILHQRLSKKAAWEKAVESLKAVGINNPERRVKQYPHEMSGGMRQRVMIAMALSCDPKLLIADEPTTALDVTIQAQILELIRDVQDRTGAALMLITHDLGVVAETVEDVVVMYAGRIVEEGSVNEVLIAPKHPYTEGLLGSIPSKGKRGERLNVIRGTVPNPFNMPTGLQLRAALPVRLRALSGYDPRIDEANRPTSPAGCTPAPTPVPPGSAASRRDRGGRNDPRGRWPPACDPGERCRATAASPAAPASPAARRPGEPGPGAGRRRASGQVLPDPGWLPAPHIGDVKAVDDVSLRRQAAARSSGWSASRAAARRPSARRSSGSSRRRPARPRSTARTIFDERASDLKKLRRRMQIIFQDPVGSLNPRMPVSDIIGEGLLAQADNENRWGNRKVRDKRVGDYLEAVGLRRDYARRYPHEFSGGQRQRIGIARALALDPDFVVCDEPVSALDVSIQSQILNLLARPARASSA